MAMKMLLLLMVFSISCGMLFPQQAATGNYLQMYISSDSGDAAAWLVETRTDAAAAFVQENSSFILRQVSPTAFILSGDSRTSVLETAGIVAVHAANSNWKCSSRLLRSACRMPDYENQLNNFLVHCRNPDSLEKHPALKMPGMGALVYRYKNSFQLRSSWAFIRQYLLPGSNVDFIDIAGTLPKEELSITSFDNSLNGINKLHSEYTAINGNGTTASVKENKPDEADIDLKGRLISTAAASNTLSTHASTMATIIAGGGNSFYTGLGVAPAAQIVSSSFAVLLPGPDAFYQQYGITVQNHSYGTGIENFYGTDAAAYDASANTNPSLLHIFSAGNQGNQAATDGSYAGISGFANITGSFKMAKNIITTGAADSFGVIAPLSSKGPAYDGRVKPDLVAYGEDGSSGAAALVSGAALVLQQAYKEKYGGALPDAALVKALLLNTASPAGNQPISFSAGYGNLDAYRAVLQLKTGQFFSASLQQAEVRNFSFSLPAAARNLKILLAWSDPAAAPNAYTALVNDLDLTVIHNTSGTQWQPWVLNSFARKDSLQLPATRKKDSLNTVEQVTIDSPAAGVYTISVNGSKLPAGAQKFFVVYQWDTAGTFEWRFPAKTDNLLPARQQLLRWRTNYAGTGLLEFKYAGSNAWQAVAAIPDLTGSYTQWLPPDSNAVVILRMTINGSQYLSDSFTISAPVQASVAFNCPDTVLLFWNRNKAAGKYTVAGLGSRYMQAFAQVTDTAVFISKNSSSASWFSIAPVLPFNKTGVYSQAIDYTAQGVNCYLSSFTADLAGNKSNLVIGLGTLFRVQRIVLEKMNTEGIYQPLQILAAPVQPQYNLTDAALHKGVNQYRVRIELGNGQVIYSNPEQVIYLAGNDYLLYPNPVHRPLSINLITAEMSNQVLQFFNMWGQQVYSQKITDLSVQLPTIAFARGIYFYAILKEGKIMARGKLVVD